MSKLGSLRAPDPIAFTGKQALPASPTSPNTFGASQDRALTLIRQGGRGRQSGVPITVHFFTLSTVRDGKVLKIEYFRHRADALRAADLEE